MFSFKPVAKCWLSVCGQALTPGEVVTAGATCPNHVESSCSHCASVGECEGWNSTRRIIKILKAANDRLHQAYGIVEGKILEHFFKGKKQNKSFSNKAQVLSAPECVPSGSEAQDATSALGAWVWVCGQ